MQRRTLLDIENRAIKNFKVVGQELPDGRYALTVTTLQGVVVERIESRDKAEAERHLQEFGYERIPLFLASDIDRESAL